jgi:hypothetical protein
MKKTYLMLFLLAFSFHFANAQETVPTYNGIVLDRTIWPYILFKESGIPKARIESDGGNFAITHTSGTPSYFVVNSTSGNVGIGTTAPGALLDIKTFSAPQLYLSTSRIYNTSRRWAIGTNQIAEGDFVILESTTSQDAPAVPRFLINVNGNVGIGTPSPDAKLTVKGSIHTEGVDIDMTGALAQIPDYVFEKDYDLLPLSELETYINQNKHLPEVPSAKEMEANGLDVKEMNLLLLKKVEELTLHLIELNKVIEGQNGRIKILEKN